MFTYLYSLHTQDKRTEGYCTIHYVIRPPRYETQTTRFIDDST